jgi:hypothetical protein
VAQSSLHLHQCEPHSCGNIQQTRYELRSLLNAIPVYKFSFPFNQDSAYDKVFRTFSRKSTSQILFATAIDFFRDKYIQLAKCGEFLHSALQSHIVRKHLLHLLHLKRFRSRVTIQDNPEATRTFNYAAHWR